jgi:homocysteine S-methyltransferase
MTAPTPDATTTAQPGTVTVLDGGLSTALEELGADLGSSLWTARLLADAPELVAAAHRAYFAAGATVAIAASYQASVPGFVAAGIGEDEAVRLIGSSVRVAQQVRDEVAAGPAAAGRTPLLVAASVGPYGAMLADGSEYTGTYVGELGVRELRAFHRPRMAVLADAGADVLACETVPAAAEAEALLAEADDLGVPVWLSLTTVFGDDGVARTRRGEPAADVFALAAGVDAVVAVGVNCTDPSGVPAALGAARAAGKPLVAYPNSGESWDAAARRWTGEAGVPDDAVRGWLDAGARLVGGCCRVGPPAIARVAAVVDQPG